jgi:malate dehydrogenase (oxaloacetate-decarboxylating)(NADP+)
MPHKENHTMAEDFKASALDYHESDPPGKLQIAPTKPLANQRDLALAYSPGVAFACEEIVNDPSAASRFTARGNLVAVVTNGTAVLGLGAIGPLAAKPVMEGKAVLFKKFAGIDVFDIEINERDPARFVEVVAALEPSFGAINLEDIKAPECFEIEEKLRARLKIPVLHDDQHGTAIVVAAAVLNGLELVGKDIGNVRLACCGAGAAALACLNLLVSLGLKRENVFVTDRVGVVYEGRTEEMNPYMAVYAQPTPWRTLAETMHNADIFLGLSAPGVVTREMVASMAPQPMVMALANPTPEILPEEVLAVRDDAIIATGRSDYPNQVNNVLCFPFLFRGALDAGATAINEEMKIACARAIAGLAREEASEIVMTAYGGQTLRFGRNYIIPKPFDPRLITELPPAVARAAMDSGVATRPITNFDAYRDKLSTFVFRSGQVMRPVFEAAKRAHKRIILAEGDRARVLQTASQLVHDQIARPLLIGNRGLIEQRLKELGLSIRLDEDADTLDPAAHPRLDEFAHEYHTLVERKGVTPAEAYARTRAGNTIAGALMLKHGEADAMICGTVGRFDRQLKIIDDIIGKRRGVADFAALSGIVLPAGTFFFADTAVNYNPTATQIVETTLQAVRQVKLFGLKPKVAFLSHSNFGSASSDTAQKMRHALAILREKSPGLEAEGEMLADVALSELVRQDIFPNSKLTGQANLLILPTLDAASIAFSLIKALGGGVSLGPILLGAAAPAHIATPSSTVRGLVNLSAIAVAGSGAMAASRSNYLWGPLE